MAQGRVEFRRVWAMVWAGLILTGAAWGQYSGGSGTAGDPYQIATAADLIALGANTGDYDQCFVLTADIDLAGQSFTRAVIAPDTDGASDGFQGVAFSGKLDGQNHVIRNLTFDCYDAAASTTNGKGKLLESGFFGMLEGELKNIRFDSIQIVNCSYLSQFGSLANVNDGIIINCSVSIQSERIDKLETFGGLVYSNHGAISRCYAGLQINCDQRPDSLAGLVMVNNGTLGDSYSSGICDLKQDADVFFVTGGVFAHESGAVYNCFSTLMFRNGAKLYVGIGTFIRPPFDNCYFYLPDNASHMSRGTALSIDQMYLQSSFAGFDFSDDDGDPAVWQLLDQEMPSLIGNGIEQALIPDLVGMDITEAEAWLNGNGFQYLKEFQFNETQPLGRIYNQMPRSDDRYPGKFAIISVSLGSGYSGGTGTSGDPFRLSTPLDLMEMGYRVEHYQKHYVLVNDIDLSEHSFFQAIIASNASGAAFTGTLDGNGYAIRNMTIVANGSNYVGFFGNLGEGSSVANLKLESVIVTGRDYVGALCGYKSAGAIDSCRVTGVVNGGALVGGMCGNNYGGTIRQCEVGGFVTGSGDAIGGLCGRNNGSIQRSCSACQVESKGSYVGGLCGLNSQGSLIGCYANDEVLGNNCTGGLCGYNSYGTIDMSYAAGPAHGNNYVGGLCGNNESGTITQCYAAGYVRGNDHMGGLCGMNTMGFITDGFWDMEATGQATSLGGTGKTTAELQNSAVFVGAGWDFSDDDGDAADWQELAQWYPALAWQAVEMVSVPDVTGMEQSEADARLRSAGLYSGGLSTSYSSTVAAGSVLRQAFAAGRSVPAGYRLGLVISLGLRYSGGNGTEEDPFLIGSPADLAFLGQTVNDYASHFALTADLDMSDWVFDKSVIAPGTGDIYTSFKGAQFQGVFDGNGHVINHLTINGTGKKYIGLFGYVGSDAQIANLELIHVAVTGYRYVGGLCGFNIGTVSQVHVSGRITGDYSVTGGLCGYSGGTIIRSSVHGDITGINGVGGLCGSSEGTINQSYALCHVSGTEDIGGLCGSIADGTVSQVYALGTVAGAKRVGGLYGSNLRGAVVQSYAAGTVQGDLYFGGLGGYNSSGSTSDCYWDIERSKQSTSAGGTGLSTAQMVDLTGWLLMGWDISVGPDSPTVWKALDRDYPYLGWEAMELWTAADIAGMTLEEIIVLLDSNGLSVGEVTESYNNYVPEGEIYYRNWLVGDAINIKRHVVDLVVSLGGIYSGGSGTESDPYLIANPEDIALLAGRTVDYGRHFLVMNTIDLSGMDYDAAVIAPDTDASYGYQGTGFAGVFDGGGHTISHLTIHAPAKDHLGLFGDLAAGGVVKHVILAEAKTTGKSNCSLLCGKNEGQISHCQTTGEVTGSYGAGGVCGYNRGMIEHCVASGTIHGGDRAGGLCGYQETGTIRHCEAFGRVAGNDLAGGLCGYNFSGKLWQSHSSSEAKGNAWVGGLCGQNDQGELFQNYASAVVTGNNEVGGLCGGNRSGLNRGTIVQCHANSFVTGNLRVGGMVGYDYNGTITDSYARGSLVGSVSGNTFGGFCGTTNAGTIARCYTTCVMKGAWPVTGGFCGNNNNRILDGFWDKEQSGQTASAGGTGLTTAQMKESALFIGAGWDFSADDGDPADWQAVAGWYPVLAWEAVAMASIPNVVGWDRAAAEAELANAGLTVIKVVKYHTDAWECDVVAEQSMAAGQVVQAGTHIVLGVSLGAGYSGGEGTEAVPYRIATANDLLEMGRNHGEYGRQFKLVADIDLAGLSFNQAVVAPSTESTGYAPFIGVFDGGGHTINHLTINGSGKDFVGLFGWLSVGGTIKNTNLKNTEIIGRDCVGGLCGKNEYGTIRQCSVNATLSGRKYLGDLCGYNHYGRIDYCYATGSVTGSTPVGGLCGYNYFGQIGTCYATGTVTGTTPIGGLCGENYGNTASIANCYSAGKLNWSSVGAGLCGKNTYGSIIRCFWDQEASGQSSYAGISGEIYAKTTKQMMTVTTYATVGWLISGDKESVSVDWLILADRYPILAWQRDAIFALENYKGRSYAPVVAELDHLGVLIEGVAHEYHDDVAAGSIIRQTPQAGADMMPGYAICLTVSKGAVPLAGRGTQEQPYELGCVEDLAVLHDEPYLNSRCFKLVSDIDLAGQPFANGVIAPCSVAITWEEAFSATPVGFVGEFDGQGHTLRNLTVEPGANGDPADDNSYYLGLFGTIGKAGVVKNLNLEAVRVVGGASSYEIGGLCGYSFGTIINCRVSGVVQGGASSQNVGGLCGSSNLGVVIDCSNHGPVQGGQVVGGLVGYGYGCAVVNCENYGDVSGTAKVGGLCGSLSYSIVSNCENEGNVAAANEGGGLVGVNSSGGLFNTVQRGSVTVSGNRAGGLVGYGGGCMNHCYSVGAVSCPGAMRGGLTGEATASFRMSGCFWDTQAGGTVTKDIGSSSGAASGLTTAQLAEEGRFMAVGWDFAGESRNGVSEIWTMMSGTGAPQLSRRTGYQPVALAGEGTVERPYLIGSAAELGAIQHYGITRAYRLTDDIDLMGVHLGTPFIPFFNGMLDGDGHVIENMTIAGDWYLGLIGLTGFEGAVSDLGLVNGQVFGTGYYVALLSGNKHGRFERCFVNGSVQGVSKVGALTGSNYRSVIRDCYATAAVSPVESSGGLVGTSSSMDWIFTSYGQQSTLALFDSAAGLKDYPSSPSVPMSTYMAAGFDFSGLAGKPAVWSMAAGAGRYPILTWQTPPGNINGDEQVDLGDYAVLATGWLGTPDAQNWNDRADLDGSQQVAAGDLVLLARDWLRRDWSRMPTGGIELISWPFDTDGRDQQGVSLGLLLNGAAVTQAAGEIRIGGGALRLDGVDDAVNCGPHRLLTDLPVFSVALWMKADAITGNTQQIMGQRDLSSQVWGLSIWGSQAGHLTGYVGATGLGATAEATLTPTAGQWMHVVMTYDDLGDRKVRIYVDGVETGYTQQTTATGAKLINAAIPVTIGDRIGGGRAFGGGIDEVRIYRRVLTAGEIAVLAGE